MGGKGGGGLFEVHRAPPRAHLSASWSCWWRSQYAIALLMIGHLLQWRAQETRQRAHYVKHVSHSPRRWHAQVEKEEAGTH